MRKLNLLLDGFILLLVCIEAAPRSHRCNRETFEYRKHWNGECPQGTTWDDRTSCCYGCPQCKPTKCISDQHEFDRHWNGQCPSGAQLDVRTGCCVKCETCVSDTNQEVSQADSPTAVCKSALNHFHKYWDGQCPSGTTWNNTINCCTGCPNCGPGWMQAPGCEGPCIPCAPWQYSSHLDNNIKCTKCTNCALLNREQSRECSPIADTVCDTCLPGYQEPEKLDKHPVSCIKVEYDPVTASPVKPKLKEKDKCDSLEGRYPAHWDESCPDRMGFDRSSSCCIPCRKCSPGYVQSTDCLSACQPCPEGSYSDHPVDNYKCIPCGRCNLLHRRILKHCTPTTNVVCGDCSFGFYSSPVRMYPGETQCLPCPGSRDPACREFHRFIRQDQPVVSIGESRHVQDTGQAEHLHWLGPLVGVIIVILLLLTMAVIVVAYFLCKKASVRKKSQDSSTSLEETEKLNPGPEASAISEEINRKDTDTEASAISEEINRKNTETEDSSKDNAPVDA